MFGHWELILILLIVVVLFGAKRLPELGKGVGEALKNFKKGIAKEEIDVTPNNDVNQEEEAKKNEGKNN